MTHTVRRQRPAMGTLFEAVLRGDDPGHLDAVASAAFDEVGRVDRLLSRFDPRGEVARVNREAATRPVKVGFELIALLQTCRTAWHDTGGFFDLTAASPGGSFDALEIDEDGRTVRFSMPGLALDFGGVGKGHALDRASEIFERFGVGHALMHGGTSSVVALGDDGEGDGWKVGIRDPFRPPGEAPEVFAVRLRDEGLSCSAVLGHDRVESDLIDPSRGTRLSTPAACAVVAGSGAVAEVYSTALLAMGKSRARDRSNRLGAAGVSAAWVEPGEGRPVWGWITEAAS